jgi:excisionase family DNA binding protein
MANLLSNSEPVTPTPEESRLARESGLQLAHFDGGNPTAPVVVRIQSGNSREQVVSIPASAFRLLQDILTQMSQGNAVTLVPIDTELTPQQAADLLNVSLPFLIKELDSGAISQQNVGTDRRILLKDLLEYKHATDRKRLQALDELAAQAQELDMGY